MSRRRGIPPTRRSHPNIETPVYDASEDKSKHSESSVLATGRCLVMCKMSRATTAVCIATAIWVGTV